MKRSFAYIAIDLMVSAQTSMGNIKFSTFSEGCIGIFPIYKTKTAARKVHGKEIELIELEEKEPHA